jgi:hypothetical protein
MLRRSHTSHLPPANIDGTVAADYTFVLMCISHVMDERERSWCALLTLFHVSRTLTSLFFFFPFLADRVCGYLFHLKSMPRQ